MQDDIDFGNVFDDNVAQQLLAAETNAPEMETLRLKPQDSPTSSDWTTESKLYKSATSRQTDFEQGPNSAILHSAYRIPLALGASIGCTIGAAILWTLLAYFIGLSWLHFLCIPVAAAAGYGLTLCLESHGAALGLLAAVIGLFGIFCGKLFLAKWVVLPRLENPFAIAAKEFDEATLDEEQIRERLKDPHLMFTAACFQMAEDGEFDHEFAEKVVQTHYDGRAPIGEAEQITEGIQKVQATLDSWSPQQKRQAVIAQFEREKQMFKEFGRSLLTAVTEANEAEVPEGIRKTARETQDLFEGTRPIQQTRIGFAMAFIGSFSFLDLLFIPMGLWAAYKVGAGRD